MTIARVPWEHIVPAIGPRIVTVSSAETLLPEDNLVKVDATSGPVTVTLPAAADGYRPITVKKIDASANAVTVDGAGSETIDGASTATLASQYDSITVYSDGTEWWAI